jgi:hypothetical protein
MKALPGTQHLFGPISGDATRKESAHSGNHQLADGAKRPLYAMQLGDQNFEVFLQASQILCGCGEFSL